MQRCKYKRNNNVQYFPAYPQNSVFEGVRGQKLGGELVEEGRIVRTSEKAVAGSPEVVEGTGTAAEVQLDSHQGLGKREDKAETEETQKACWACCWRRDSYLRQKEEASQHSWTGRALVYRYASPSTSLTLLC